MRFSVTNQIYIQIWIVLFAIHIIFLTGIGLLVIQGTSSPASMVSGMFLAEREVYFW